MTNIHEIGALQLLVLVAIQENPLRRKRPEQLTEVWIDVIEGHGSSLLEEVKADGDGLVGVNVSLDDCGDQGHDCECFAEENTAIPYQIIYHYYCLVVVYVKIL